MLPVRTRIVLPAALALAALAAPACDSMEGDNRAARRGAAGGALVGLTMGALTGDADLAMRGAIAGGVAGGVAGSMSDLEAERAQERTDTMADAIVGRGGGAPVPQESRPQTWERLDVFPGTWSCAIWGLDDQGNRVTATATMTGALVSTRAARLTLDAFDATEFGDDVDASFGGGFSTLTYDPATGYELVNEYSLTPGAQRWVGERMAGEERYSFYYVGADNEGVLGTARSQLRLELRFVGRDVILIDSYAPDGSGEKQVQSYRLTRRS